MREPVRDRDRLSHMLDAIDVILANVEIIGEACYKLSRDFRTKHPEIDWDAIEGMRHVLVHGYYQISKDQLWETVVNDIPSLKVGIESLLKQK